MIWLRPILLVAAVLLVSGCTQNKPEKFAGVGNMNLTSSAFAEGGMIPARYTCDGEDINPPLKIEGVPAGAKSLALIVDDPDAPMGTWVHWVVWDIDSKMGQIAEKTVPGVEGVNSFRRTSYGGPCPPSGTHRYVFKLYALDEKLKLPPSFDKGGLLVSMETHIMAQAQLVGKYKRP